MTSVHASIALASVIIDRSCQRRLTIVVARSRQVYMEPTISSSDVTLVTRKATSGESSSSISAQRESNCSGFAFPCPRSSSVVVFLFAVVIVRQVMNNRFVSYLGIEFVVSSRCRAPIQVVPNDDNNNSHLLFSYEKCARVSVREWKKAHVVATTSSGPRSTNLQRREGLIAWQTEQVKLRPV